jgi:hypothetical protein
MTYEEVAKSIPILIALQDLEEAVEKETGEKTDAPCREDERKSFFAHAIGVKSEILAWMIANCKEPITTHGYRLTVITKAVDEEEGSKHIEWVTKSLRIEEVE